MNIHISYEYISKLVYYAARTIVCIIICEYSRKLRLSIHCFVWEFSRNLPMNNHLLWTVGVWDDFSQIFMDIWDMCVTLLLKEVTFLHSCSDIIVSTLKSGNCLFYVINCRSFNNHVLEIPSWKRMTFVISCAWIFTENKFYAVDVFRVMGW